MRRYDDTPDWPQQFVSRVTPGHSPFSLAIALSRCPRLDPGRHPYNPWNPYNTPARLIQGV